MLVTTPVALPFALVCKRDLKVIRSSRTYDEWWNSDGGRHRFVPFDLELFYRYREGVVKTIHMSGRKIREESRKFFSMSTPI